MAIALHSFQRYLDAGVRVAMGTDTYPMDMVAELRWASMLAKVTDANYQAGQPRDVYNAATLGACRFLRRDDLGRLAPGARADIVLVRLDHLGAAFYADPIKALVDFACGRDVDTVIVDGQVLVQGGRAVRVDEAAVYARAREATHRYWQQVPTWHWGGHGVDRIIPPAFPIRSRDGLTGPGKRRGPARCPALARAKAPAPGERPRRARGGGTRAGRPRTGRRTPLDRLRAICLALPEATEKLAWGEPTWRVGGKLFGLFDDHHHGAEHVAVWLPAPPLVQDELVEADPERFFVPPYVGHRGWIGVRLDRSPDWRAVSSLVEQAYRQVAPRRLLAALGSRAGIGGDAAPRPGKASSVPVWRADPVVAPGRASRAGRGYLGKRRAWTSTPHGGEGDHEDQRGHVRKGDESGRLPHDQARPGQGGEHDQRPVEDEERHEDADHPRHQAHRQHDRVTAETERPQQQHAGRRASQEARDPDDERPGRRWRGARRPRPTPRR